MYYGAGAYMKRENQIFPHKYFVFPCAASLSYTYMSYK